MTLEDRRRLQATLILRDVRQAAVAQRLGMDETKLSKILNGWRPAPADFEQRFMTAVNDLAPETAGASA